MAAPGRGRAPCWLSKRVCTEFLRQERRQKWGLQIMMLRASGLLPLREESKQKTQWEDAGAAEMAGREMRKKQSLLFERKFLS